MEKNRGWKNWETFDRAFIRSSHRYASGRPGRYKVLFDNFCWSLLPNYLFHLSYLFTICVKVASLGDFLLVHRGWFDTAALKLLLCLAASFLSSLSQVVDTTKPLKSSPSYVLICFYLICSCTLWISFLAGDFSTLALTSSTTSG